VYLKAIHERKLRGTTASNKHGMHTNGGMEIAKSQVVYFTQVHKTIPISLRITTLIAE
jgi:hypothetical protein